MADSQTSGVLVIDKPTGVTSRTVVDRVESEWDGIKAGHGGTLDLLADGVLPVLLGRATRLTQFLQQLPKSYRLHCRFDRASDTLDREGDVREVPVDHSIERKELASWLDTSTGTTEQIPPRYSAIQSDGERAYDMARAGRDFELESRRVECHSIDIVEFDFPRIVLDIDCGKGFYIRSLVRDTAEAFDLTGGMATHIRRTGYGPFDLDGAADLDTPSKWRESLFDPVAIVRDFPTVEVSGTDRKKVTHGAWLRRTDAQHEWAAALDNNGQLLAMLKATDKRGTPQWWPKKVFQPEH